MILLLALIFGAFYLKYPSVFWERLLPIPKGPEVAVSIKPGMSARDSARAFFEEGALTDSPAALARWMARFGIDRKLQPGIYRLVRGDAWNVARQLKVTRPAVFKLTLVPGTDIFSLRELFDDEETPSTSSEDSVTLALMDDLNYPEAMRPCLFPTEEGRLSLLLPETYFVAEKTPDALVRLASASWWSCYEAQALSLTSADLLKAATIASMVQREALWDSERPAIASVIKNRIQKKMPLQIDATVVYAWKLKGRKVTRVLYSDLSLKSPYNTYWAPGLPPAPICAPSLASWEAALGSEKNDYYYYVAKKDGYHYFAKTYAEHRKNIRKARAK
ncbi:MAG: endolytic transglycosylase MltG [Fretibacterium sp.]|nr:endolytic transglycosylase MltG [Fretibacterium sp.]